MLIILKQMIRLAKFWFKTLHLGRNIYGLKTAFEVIAVSVAKAEFNQYTNKKTTKSKLHCAFSEFLQQVMKIDTIRLAFIKINGTWTQLEDHEIPQALSDDKYFILEPTNIFNDLTQEFEKRKEELNNLKRAAKITYDRIQGIKVVSPFAIFRPVFKISELFERKNLPFAFICDYFEDYKKYDCTCHKNSPDLSEQILKVLKPIEVALSTCARVVASEIRTCQEHLFKLDITEQRENREIIELMQRMIREDIMNGESEHKDNYWAQGLRCDLLCPFLQVSRQRVLAC